MIAALLASSGLRAGLATKPQLQSYRERVRVEGVAIGKSEFAVAVDRVQPLVEALTHRAPDAGQPTTFELTTVLAFSHFAATGCAAAVVEVGLGGRYDATNACDPLVSVITAISHDHTRELGTSLVGIAREKAGIMRPGRVTVIGPQDPPVALALTAEGRHLGAQVRTVRAITQLRADELGLPLRGAHQRANAAEAITVIEALAEHGLGDGIPRPAALAGLGWPGRFEVISGEPPIVLDVAHNDGSADALAATLRVEFPRRRIRFVLGIMADKDARAVLRPLLPLAASVEATRPPSPRGLDARALGKLIRRVPVRTHDEIASALAAARSAAGPHDVVCVTGSVALVGAARSALGLPLPERLWPAIR
jgi:dihydrofolate synthase/folylpolyglutamate synthase